MKELMSIVQAGLVVGAGAFSLGLLLLAPLGLKFRGGERWPAAFAFGLACYSVLYRGLWQAGLARRGFTTALGIALAVLAAWRVRSHEDEPSPAPPAYWRVARFLAFGFLGAAWLLAALAPDTTPDPLARALAQAAMLGRRLSLDAGETWSAAAPLWLAAFGIGRQSACALMHLLSLCGMTAVVIAATRRIAGPSAGAIAGILVFTNPAFGAFAGGASTELLFLLEACAAAWLSCLTAHTRQWRMAVPAAACAVFAVLLSFDPRGEAFPGYVFRWLPGGWTTIPAFAAVLAWVFHRHTASALMLVTFAAGLSWPRALRIAAEADERLPEIPSPPAVTRKIPPDRFLAERLPGFIEARFLEERTPPDAYILSESAVARAWANRRVSVNHEMLAAGWSLFEMTYEPRHVQTVHVNAEPRRSWQKRLDGRAAEIRFFIHGQEVPRERGWRVRCPQAFDNSDVTSCAGRVEVQFPTPAVFDEVRTYGTQGSQPYWPRGLRRAAYVEWKRAGVTHLLTARGSELTEELQQNPRYWGVTELGERNGAWLFRLD